MANDAVFCGLAVILRFNVARGPVRLAQSSESTCLVLLSEQRKIPAILQSWVACPQSGIAGRVIHAGLQLAPLLSPRFFPPNRVFAK